MFKTLFGWFGYHPCEECGCWTNNRLSAWKLIQVTTPEEIENGTCRLRKWVRYNDEHLVPKSAMRYRCLICHFKYGKNTSTSILKLAEILNKPKAITKRLPDGW